MLLRVLLLLLSVLLLLGVRARVAPMSALIVTLPVGALLGARVVRLLDLLLLLHLLLLAVAAIAVAVLIVVVVRLKNLFS